MTPEEFDRRIEDARKAGIGKTSIDRAYFAALELATKENPAAVGTLSWNHSEKRMSLKTTMAKLKAIATGNAQEIADLYATKTCGECAHAIDAVFCPITHRVMLADSNGDPGDYRCEASRKLTERKH